MGGRILVFGRPGRLLADIDLRTWPAAQVRACAPTSSRYCRPTKLMHVRIPEPDKGV